MFRGTCKRQFETCKINKTLKHQASDKDKPVDFFCRKESLLATQKRTMINQTTVTVKALTASYEVAYFIGKAKSPIRLQRHSFVRQPWLFLEIWS